MNSKNESLLGFLKNNLSSPIRLLGDSKGYEQRSNYAPSEEENIQISRGLNRTDQEDFAGRSTGNILRTNAPYIETNRYQYNVPEPRSSPRYNFEIKDLRDRAMDQKLSPSGLNNSVWTDLMTHSSSF